MIVRHPDIFYERRDLFVPLIFHYLPKYYMQNSSDFRNLFVDLIDVVVNWEYKRALEISSVESEPSESSGCVSFFFFFCG